MTKTKRPSPGPERLSPKKACNDSTRAHLDHQERAYVAASRRADRSLADRIKSAEQASEVHRKRTGKGLKITPEIVEREEMYEEEDDEFSRGDMASRANAYYAGHSALASEAHAQEIERQFAEAFPMVAMASRTMRSSYPAQGAQPAQPVLLQHLYDFGNYPQDPDLQGGLRFLFEDRLQGYHPQAPAHQVRPSPAGGRRRQSVPNALAPNSPPPTYAIYGRPSHGRRSSTCHSSLDVQISPADSTTPGSIASMTTTTPITDFSGEPGRENEFSHIPMDPSLTGSISPAGHTATPFTSDLSADKQMLVGAMNAGQLIGSESYYALPHDLPLRLSPEQILEHHEPVFEQDDPESKQHEPVLGQDETVFTQEPPANTLSLQQLQPQDLRSWVMVQADSATPNVDFEEWITEEPAKSA